ncbi:hypothetical protein [Entomospira entomophila]|uniref:Uncharacterized protein n=1 Tax=Entomospira entomophila TaxID=2719988 RepID=A0A968GDP9_9SPIO|nr:hypothetical protein [Entomospira entomophilus]NIZ40534.1 hypothetical protein [Entomospira entomophilus]
MVHAQTSNNTDTSSPPPRIFSTISLGMSYDAVIDALKTDPNFVFRGRPDVSMLDPLDRTIIEVRGSGFVYRGFFSFYQDTLFAITIVLNESWLDFFTVWQSLTQTYGQPTDLNPLRSIWEDDNTRLSLEQPAVLKYLDMQTFNLLLERTNTDKSTIERSREKFLEGL